MRRLAHRRQGIEERFESSRSLNRRGEELTDALTKRPPPPVTLPELSFLKKGTPLDNEPERREVAARFAEHRTVRAGLDAWEAIGKAESFEAWKRIGAALAIGKTYALKISGANQAWGQNYSREFSPWVRQYGFDKMPAATRSVAIELHENAEAIEHWRSTLDDRTRRRLVHPLSNVRRWRTATTHNGRSPQDLRRDAKAAWTRFCALTMELPVDEARPLWQSVAAEATTHVG